MFRRTTDRLVIREYTVDDFNEVYSIFSNPQTMGFWPKPLDEEQTRQWIERSISSYREYGFGRWVVIWRESGTIIGDCGIMRSTINHTMENDLGYIIHHPYWKQGFGYEAARACLEYGLNELGLDRLCANMPWNHEASKATAEKLGMKKELEFINARNRDILTCLYTVQRG